MSHFSVFPWPVKMRKISKKLRANFPEWQRRKKAMMMKKSVAIALSLRYMDGEIIWDYSSVSKKIETTGLGIKICIFS